MWMNAFKAVVATLCFFIALLVSKDFSHWPDPKSLMAFFISGLVGLNIGDVYLMKAFTRIGPARTLIIFSFQPIILGFFAYVLFAQELELNKMIAIGFMIACVFTMAYEKFKQEGHWELLGPLYAVLGVLFDSCGILLTRYAFNSDPQVTTTEGNFYRCIGAITGFVIMSQMKPFRLVSTFKSFSKKSKMIVALAALLGTFISLSLYLNAVRYGALAAVSAIVGTGPIFAALFEAIANRKWPSKYLCLALALFGVGFHLLF
jgi:drug/metabolite transporter (DMT)-like permease